MIYNNIILINPLCPRPSLTMQNRDLKHQLFHMRALEHPLPLHQKHVILGFALHSTFELRELQKQGDEFTSNFS